MTINKVILLGRLGKDPELKYTAQNFPICNFSLATSKKVKEGESYKEKTEWHNIVILGKTAENASKYTKKGSMVYLEGEIQTRKWQDKEGKDRYTTEILGNTIQFLDSKSEKTETQPSREPTAEQLSAPTSSFDDDEIPF